MNTTRQPLIAGNWKMSKTSAEACEFVGGLLERLGKASSREVAVFPPFTAIPAVASVLRGSAIAYGGQNCHWESSGAFTGEVAAGFLAELGCRYVLVGHSERRALFGETDETCRRKVQAAIAAGLTPVLCCGETLSEREAGATFERVDGQLAGALPERPVSPIVVAYEPVWAIGTGRSATADQAQEVHAHIRAWLAARISPAPAASTRVIYGGSVKPDNIADLMRQPDVDGTLVGGASLDIDSFCRIVESVGG